MQESGRRFVPGSLWSGECVRQIEALQAEAARAQG
jgi:hypothetical protein